MFQKAKLAEWSKAVDLGSIPKGRGFKPHTSHFLFQNTKTMQNHTNHFLEFLNTSWTLWILVCRWILYANFQWNNYHLADFLHLINFEKPDFGPTKKVDIPIFLVTPVDILTHGYIFNGFIGNVSVDSYFARNCEIVTPITIQYCNNCLTIRYFIHAFALLLYVLYRSAFFIRLLIERHYYLYMLAVFGRQCCRSDVAQHYFSNSFVF